MALAAYKYVNYHCGPIIWYDTIWLTARQRSVQIYGYSYLAALHLPTTHNTVNEKLQFKKKHNSNDDMIAIYSFQQSLQITDPF